MENSRDRTVVVLDWDDTLCPSTVLQEKHLVPKFGATKVELSDEMAHELSLVEAAVQSLLEEATSYGPVFIVTAAEKGWVEMSSELFLPALVEPLAHEDVHVVSARSWYEKEFGYDGRTMDWKEETFKVIANECFSQDDDFESSFNLVSIGDSMVERDVCHSIADTTPFTIAKTLKFIARPTIQEVVQQVELATDVFEHLCGTDSTIDLRLSRLHLATLSKLEE